MKKYNIGISIVLILISVMMIRMSNGYGSAAVGTAMGAGVWPSILACIMIILSVILLVQSLIRKSDGEEPIDFKSPGMRNVYILIILLIIFAAALKLLGFYPAIAFLVVSVMWLLGERRIWFLALMTAGILLFVYVVFVVLLSLKFPSGILFR